VWAWLAPVLAFTGTLILFGGSLIVLWRTNQAADRRTTDALQNERDRDFRLWQRDTLLRLGDETVQAATAAYEECAKLRNASEPLTGESFEPMRGYGREIFANMARLRLIGAHTTAARCKGLEIAVKSGDLHNALVDLDRVKRMVVKDEETASRESMAMNTYVALAEEINTRCIDVAETVESELARTTEPRGMPQTAESRHDD
jgi:hypothetical protein